MKFRRNTGFLVLFLFTAFFLSACGGGGGSSAPPTPVVTTDNATGVTNVAATLNGTVNPNGLATQAWFEWGTSPTLVAPDNTAKQNFAAGTTVQAVTASLPTLTFGTTYYFRLVASNSSGETKGTPILNFATSAQRPTVTTLAADNAANTSATLHGQVNPNFLPTAAWFEYGSSPTLAGATISPEVAIGSGSSVVPTSLLITGQPFGGTVFFRAAASNGAGELKGDIDNVSLLNPPPVANAGPDNNAVEMGQTVTLDGSGSTTPFGTIVSYQWAQVAGTTVTLDNIAAIKPTFTAPDNVARTGEVLRFQLTVTDSRSLTASDNVDIIVKWIGFADDFSSNTTSTYAVVLGTTGAFTWDSTGKRAQLDTGDNNLSKFSKAVLASASGVFSLDFSPTTAYPSHGGIWLRLVGDDNNYYEISNFDWGVGTPTAPDIAAVKKVVGGVVVDTVAIPTAYTQGNTYNIKITFSPTQVKLEGFGAAVTLNTANTTAISVTSFGVEAGQQDATYDNIKLIAAP